VIAEDISLISYRVADAVEQLTHARTLSDQTHRDPPSFPAVAPTLTHFKSVRGRRRSGVLTPSPRP
jgi:hypothetical protein